MDGKIKSPSAFLGQCAVKIKKEHKIAFVAAFVQGLLIHMPALLMDVPNHDGLRSLYFDQNMITSGRWFLTVACGFSSYYTLPWLIGLLGIFFLACTAVVLTELLEIKDPVTIVLLGGLLVSFPALASTFAYVFTLDGYMMGLFLAVSAVLCVKKNRFGFVGGAVCLAFSMGTYQAYLPFAILLCIYEVLELCMGQDTVKNKFVSTLKYLGMGVLGVAVYYIVLRILLLIQGRELDTYQGINGMDSAGKASAGQIITHIYRDFLAFTCKGNVFVNNLFSVVAVAVLAAAVFFVAAGLCIRKNWWKSLWFFVIIVLLAVVLPLGTNVILLISPDVTYHLLMRYQWVVYLILAVSFVSRHAENDGGGTVVRWCVTVAAFVMIFHYALVDNIGYSNLQKKYEKTYAYCLRLLDRIEQTEGYYQGIPVAMIGVVGDDPYPVTDYTLPVTSNMIGLNGDSLLYTAENYEAFIRSYLGATLNMMSPDEMGNIYYSEEYMEMESFPADSSVRLVDGIIYVKTENARRD